MKLQKKVDMSDGERTVQTWRPNPLPSANKGSNVKSSYINRHTDPQKEKTVFSFLDCSLMGNAPMAPIYGHMQHICNTFSLQASDGQGFQSILRLATSGATAACTSLGPSSSCGNNDGSPGSSDDVRSVYPPVLANDATVKGKSMIKQLDTVCSAISQRPWNQPKEEHLFQMPCFLLPNRMNHIGRTAPHFLSTPLAGRIAVGLPAYPPPTKICGNRWSKCRGSYWKLCLIMFL